MTRISPNLALRYALCFFGILIIALGVSISTKANLGTTPISAIPYVASLGFQPSIGSFTIVFNLLLVAGQVLIMRDKFPRIQYMQIPVSCMFGLFIDTWMYVLPEFGFDSYAAKLGALALGTMVLALGVYMEVSAGVVMMAGEGAVKMLSILTKKDYGILKTCFDTTLVIFGATFSFVLFSEFRGIGEGSIVSALFVGIFVKIFHSLRQYARG